MSSAPAAGGLDESGASGVEYKKFSNMESSESANHQHQQQGQNVYQYQQQQQPSYLTNQSYQHQQGVHHPPPPIYAPYPQTTANQPRFPWMSMPSQDTDDGNDDDDDIVDDIYSIRRPIKTSYKEVIIENKQLQNFEATSIVNRYIFKYTQLALYRLLSILVGWAISCTCGILFGLVNFLVVFLIQPSMKFVFVFMRIAQVITKAFIRSFMDPCFQSVGQHLSFMRGNFNLNVTKTTAASEATAAQEAGDGRVASINHSGVVQQV